MQVSAEEYKEFRDFLQNVAGIDLADNKLYLVKTRIRRILLKYEFQTLGHLTHAIKFGRNMDLCQQIIDAMTTNETFWFRDSYPYECLRNQVLPELQKAKARSARIWSAACSSGQEPYSISMVIDECSRMRVGAGDVNVEIIGTDLSSSILDIAKKGEYDRLSVGRGLSEERLKKFFEERSKDCWKVKDHVKKRITFKSLNLLESYLLLGRFDVVFCRNVLIYFSSELKRDILSRMHEVMKPGAWLFLGSSENLSGLDDLFETVYCSPGVAYRAIKK